VAAFLIPALVEWTWLGQQWGPLPPTAVCLGTLWWEHQQEHARLIDSGLEWLQFVYVRNCQQTITFILSY